MKKGSGKRPELLAPAGSLQSLRAAIEGGADAVYVGGTAFNARIHAPNFTAEDLREGIKLAHAYGIKVYVAANILIYDRELDSFLHAAEEAYLCGADALIVADIGAAQKIKARIPIELHASTQLSGHNAAAAHILADAGFSRMVCAREMSRDDLFAFVQNSPIESEVFVHGALCVCHSGQCLFSSAVGGRSGNRGECAQPCRLPYQVRGKAAYPLSLKDLSLSCHVSELIDMGIDSFKIEGRMKSPEYVRDVTRIWRRLIDEGRNATREEMQELISVFSRSGFTDGYYVRKIDRNMLGVRSENDKQNSRTLEPFSGITRKIPVDFSVEIHHNQPIKLTVLPANITVVGDIPQPALTAPIHCEDVRRSLSKLGATPYMARHMDISLDDGLMVPVSALNALRRMATEALAPTSQRSEGDFNRNSPTMKPSGKRIFRRTAVFYRPDEIPAEARAFFDLIFVPLEHNTGIADGVLLPPVIFDSEKEEVAELLKSAVRNGAKHVLIGNPGHFDLISGTNLCPHGDFRLNITNNASAAFYESMGLEDFILSPELTLPQMRDIGGKSAAIVYGRLPLMITENCIGKEIGNCDSCTAGKLMLTDRRNVDFPVLRIFRHRSMILNSVPLYMADRSRELAAAGITMQVFLFTTESGQEIRSVIHAYKTGAAPSGEIKRIR